MSVPPAQAETDAFLRALTGAEPAETPISLVYVGADTVWKLKKAVRLDFLDFSTLEARERFARRELALNGPAAPGLYRDVVPVTRGADGGLAVGEDRAEAVDWVVRMVRVPAVDFLDRIAADGGLTPGLLESVADAVAAYHQALAPVCGTDPASALRDVVLGNVRSARRAGLAARDVDAWRDAVLAALEPLAAWQRGRARDGFVRRGHGDLHLGNMCLWRGRPVPFDALEFDEAMATTDLGYDLAFLLMDLAQRADLAAANRVLSRYVARTGDAALTRGLPAFMSVRALVRAHVEAARGREQAATAYLAAARELLAPRPSLVVAVGGLPGTGKSTLARALAPELGRAPGALVLRSDEIRKRRFAADPETRLPAEAYAAPVSAVVFAELAATARATAAGGQAVVADATYLDPATRVAIAEAARAAGVPFVGLWLDAPLDALEARIRARRGDASDATVDVLRRTAAANVGAGDWHAVDASDSGAALTRARVLTVS